MTFTLPYPPSSNHRLIPVRFGKFTRMVLSPLAREYIHVAAVQAHRQGIKPIAGDVSVAMDVFRPKRVGDLDGCFKMTFDALKGIAWIDDKQVVQINARRHEDPKNPRVEIRVMQMEREEEEREEANGLF